MQSAAFVSGFLLIASALFIKPCLGRDTLELRENGIPAVLVNVSLSITKMKITNIKTMDVMYEVLVNQRWVDQRLSPDERTLKLAVARAVWKPKVTFSEGQSQLAPAESTQFWRGKDAGNVLYSEKFIVHSDCTKNFQQHPFDKQRCFLKLSTYVFPMNEVYLKWQQKSPLKISFNSDLNYFTVIDVMRFSEVEKRTTGNFTVLVTEMLLARNADHLLITGLLPSVLLVFTSYLTFWMDLKAKCSRIVVSFVSTLAIMFVHHSMTSDLPHTPYTKPSDVWMLMCGCFTLLPLVEIVSVLALSQDHSDKDLPAPGPRLMSKQFISSILDRLSRLVHPLLFLCCTAILAVCYVV